MSINYDKHNWAYGEEITPDKLNNVENGIKANTDAINEVNNNFDGACIKTLPNTGTSTVHIVKSPNVEQLFIVAAKSANDVNGSLSILVAGGSNLEATTIFETALSDSLNPVRDGDTITLQGKKDWQHFIVVSNYNFTLG